MIVLYVLDYFNRNKQNSYAALNKALLNMSPHSFVKGITEALIFTVIMYHYKI